MDFLMNIRKNLRQWLCIFLISSLLMGCFNNVDTSLRQTNNGSQGPVSEITDAQFSGASMAVNKVTGIEITWVAATAPVQAYRLYRIKGSKLELIASVGGEVTSLVDGSVTWGAIYSYVVKAVDVKGVEDANEKRVSSLAWGGLAAVTPESATSIKVTFDSSSAVADEIRIYIQPAMGGEKELVASVSPSDGQYTINDLRPGYSYNISAQAYVNVLKKEDGNTVKWKILSNTLGYHDNGADLARWRNVTSVRAFGEAPGAPVHPLLLEKSPKDRVVELTFNSFNSLGVSQKYVVIRAPEGMPIDTSAVESCTSSTNRSCRPCGVLQGSGSLFCRDSNVAASPARYRYTMAIIHTDGAEEWVEPLPVETTDNFSVLVPIPPRNMVLVQRDAANYEMCVTQMSKFSDPRNKNRCSYTGAGAVPYNSGIGKPALSMDRSYYDFGYNLFVDRFPLSCNWTTQGQGGKCGPGGTDGDCVLSGATGSVPSNTLGAEGNVLWYLTSSTYPTIGTTNCYVKTAGQWRSNVNLQSAVINYSDLFKTMLTNDPTVGNAKKPITFGSTSAASEMASCQAFEDENYGKKRIPRLREHRVYSAFPTVSGEPYALTYSQASTLNNGGRWNATDGYRCLNAYGNMNTPVAPDMVPASLAEMLSSTTKQVAAFDPGGGDYGFRSFVQGAANSVDCMSRYGVHDVASPLYHHVSDFFTYDQTTAKYRGIASPLDSGNVDVLTDAVGGNSGYLIDGAQGTISSAPNQYRYLYYSSSTVNYFNVPFGISAFLTSSSQYLPKSSFTDHFGASMTLAYLSGVSGMYVPSVQGSRWNIRLMEQGVTSGTWLGSIRCVLPAE